MGDEVNQPLVKLCFGSSTSPISSVNKQYFRYFKKIKWNRERPK